LAWILSQMADLKLSVGRLDESEGLIRSAQQKFPGYYQAQETAARIQTARQHYSEAVELLRQRNQNFATPGSLYALAEALERAGRTDEAHSAYREFENGARLAINSIDNANEQLIFYYLGHGNRPLEALRIARIEFVRRHDVGTLDAYAWALFSNGRYEEAQAQINKALAVGVRDATIFYHAGVVAEGVEDHSAARRFLNASLELNPSSESAGAVRQALEKLTPAAAEFREPR
jgi:tetratricopeptide (TPR) repeat protein